MIAVFSFVRRLYDEKKTPYDEYTANNTTFKVPVASYESGDNLDRKTQKNYNDLGQIHPEFLYEVFQDEKQNIKIINKSLSNITRPTEDAMLIFLGKEFNKNKETHKYKESDIKFKKTDEQKIFKVPVELYKLGDDPTSNNEEQPTGYNSVGFIKPSYYYDVFQSGDQSIIKINKNFYNVTRPYDPPQTTKEQPEINKFNRGDRFNEEAGGKKFKKTRKIYSKFKPKRKKRSRKSKKVKSNMY